MIKECGCFYDEERWEPCLHHIKTGELISNWTEDSGEPDSWLMAFQKRVTPYHTVYGTWKNSNAFVKCDQGHTHWGPHGAAGIVFYHEDENGTKHYLMQRRSNYVEEGGTMGVIGGATEKGETPVQGAYREASEELGFLPDHTITGHHVIDHGGWKYTTFFAKVDKPFDIDMDSAPESWEHSGYSWHTKEEMQHPSFPIHPYFQQGAFKVLTKSIKCSTDDMNAHVDENGRRTITRCGYDAYTYKCTQCGEIGSFRRDNSGMEWSGAFGYNTLEEQKLINEMLRRARP